MQFTLAYIINFLQQHQIHIDHQLSEEQLSIVIDSIAPLDTATQHQLSFLANPKYSQDLTTTQAKAVLVHPNQIEQVPPTTLPIVTANPYLAYALLSRLFAYQSENKNPFIHPTAIIAPTAKIGENVTIGAYCVIGDNVEIGDNSRLEHHVNLEDFVKIGKNCHIKSHGFIAHHCEIGDFVMLHSHASIGNEGFGFAPKGMPDTAGWQKIHQLGNVIIGNHVRIGSQTCIDRGALGDTIIGDNVIIDNLVQIAHNVQIGDGTAIAACTGIAGSSKIGKRCVLAGGVGLVGHITLCDDVTITGMTMVTKSITQAGSYSSGTPMLATPLWKRAAIKFKRLAQI